MNGYKLVLGNKNYSSWSFRPWFFLKILGIDFDEEMVFLYENDTSKKMSAYNSNGKVPVLIDSSDSQQPLEVWDSLAIIEYIADKYPDLQGWPASLNARAIARSISAEMHSNFDSIRSTLSMNCRKHFPNHPISTETQQDIDRITKLWEFCSTNYGNGGPWLFGEFSGADAMYAPVVLRFTGYDIKLSGFAQEYSQMVMENKYMQEWIAAGKQETQIIDFDEI